VSPASVTLRVGDRTMLSVVALDQFGNVINVPGPTSWSSSNPGVVSINGNGNLRAESAGTATVTVTVGGKSGSVGVTVTR
jgi:uncharacterized protein YjdB